MPCPDKNVHIDVMMVNKSNTCGRQTDHQQPRIYIPEKEYQSQTAVDYYYT
jgi:hypothetical protein